MAYTVNGMRWSSEQVRSVAPDAASVAAAGKLAATGRWSGEGCTEAAVWGLCAGSGKNPYQTVVDLSGPAYKCSCPSRKFPCKHALALLLRWAAQQVPEANEPADFAAAWLLSRTERAEKAAAREAKRPAGSGPADPEAAAKRVALRAERVASGMEELDRWLADQVRAGIARLPAAGYPHLDAIAARMVDAQAPGIARRLRGLAGALASGPAWPLVTLQELALLRLLVHAHRRLPELDVSDPPFAATVRQHVGYPLAKETVLATPGVRDTWSVYASRDTELDTLRSRTVWLEGERTGRAAVVLSFAPVGGQLDASLVPGTSVVADLHFYPGPAELRALVGERVETAAALAPHPVSLDEALESVAKALAGDPWLRSWPVWVEATPSFDGESWTLSDAEGGLAFRSGEVDPWLALSLSGGHPIATFLEWSPAGWNPLAYFVDGMLVDAAGPFAGRGAA